MSYVSIPLSDLSYSSYRKGLHNYDFRFATAMIKIIVVEVGEAIIFDEVPNTKSCTTRSKSENCHLWV